MHALIQQSQQLRRCRQARHAHLNFSIWSARASKYTCCIRDKKETNASLPQRNILRTNTNIIKKNKKNSLLLLHLGLILQSLFIPCINSTIQNSSLSLIFVHRQATRVWLLAPAVLYFRA
jgi:hypothetical protein